MSAIIICFLSLRKSRAKIEPMHQQQQAAPKLAALRQTAPRLASQRLAVPRLPAPRLEAPRLAVIVKKYYIYLY